MAISNQSRVLSHWACEHILEELAQRARSSGAARLLAVDVVHGGIPGNPLVPALGHAIESPYIHMPNAKL